MKKDTLQKPAARTGPLVASLVASLVVLGLGSCEPEVESPKWEPIDYQGLLDDLANPTGPLINDNIEDTLAAFEEATGLSGDELGSYIELINVVYEQVDGVLDAVAESDGDDPDPAAEDAGGSIEGINVYARQSCIGPDPETPNVDFEFGQIRFESSSFSFDEYAEEGLGAQLVGDVLTRWESCRSPDYVLDGDGPGFISDASNQIALDLAVTASRVNDGTSRLLDSRLLLTLNSIDVIVETEPGVFYVFGIAVGAETEFRLGTAEGFYSCTAAAGEYSCEKEDAGS